MTKAINKKTGEPYRGNPAADGELAAKRDKQATQQAWDAAAAISAAIKTNEKTGHAAVRGALLQSALVLVIRAAKV